MMYVLGFLTGAFIAAMFLPRHASLREKPKKVSRPEVGSRWNFRGHDGDVLAVERSVLLFVHDEGGSQTVPVDYFMAVAKHRGSLAEEVKP